MNKHGGIALSLFLLSACQSASDLEVQGKVTHVRDADTIEVRGIPIRFNGVDSPELDEPGGVEGKRWMTRSYGEQTVRCILTGEKTYDRWVGTCYGSSGEDISAEVIAAGFARDCPRYSGGRYQKFETARSRSRPMKRYCQ